VKNKKLFLRLLAVIVSLLLAYPVMAQSFKISPALEIMVEPGGSVITTASAVAADSQTLENPVRIVVDLPGIVVRTGRVITINKKHSLFKTVRIGRHPDFTRIVYDLVSSEEPVLSVKVSGKKIFIGAKPVAVEAGSSKANESKTKESEAGRTPPPAPTIAPTLIPTKIPTAIPTIIPTRVPTPVPTASPTATPASTKIPTVTPTFTPTRTATASPTPTSKPVILAPTITPQTPITPTFGPEGEKVSPGEPRAALAQTNPLELKFSVNKMIVAFADGERPVADLVLKNRGEQSLFMRSSSWMIKNPGMPAEEKVTTKTLVASPQRFEIEPNQERTVRIILNRGESTSDEGIFRVQFSPDSQPFELKAETAAGRSIQLDVAAAISVLVIAQPKTLKPLLNWEWQDNTLKVENKGNTNVLLERGQLCGAEKCSELAAKRVYPGASWNIPVTNNYHSASFMQKIGDDFQPLSLSRP